MAKKKNKNAKDDLKKGSVDMTSDNAISMGTGSALSHALINSGGTTERNESQY